MISSKPKIAFIVLFLASQLAETLAFSTANQAGCRRDSSSRLAAFASCRRNFFSTSLVAGILVGGVSQAEAAPAADVTAFSDKGLTVVDAKTRFQSARKDLRYLLDNYSEISKGGGDAVRNSLGTQGVNSNLFGIQKVLKLLRDESEDIVEYTEAMDEFNAYYYQAEGAAYQSMFAGHSSSKSTPESLLVTAKEDIVQMTKYMDQLAVQLNL